ncbi:UDP-N-acetylmuramate:L-alanyl-gamma-D-glutamyl-meso-diaminopimelate ligase [Magnetococcales bacterium HHB-1]
MKHLHIIGVCGVAMAGIAALAKESGWRVTGSDQGVYPPMSDFLQQRGIGLLEGFSADHLRHGDTTPDLVLVGNAISRGNPELEAVLNRGLPYQSGAAWLYDHLLEGRHPVVVAGTHGKTTTSTLASWLWESMGWQPGFFIGGIPKNFAAGVRFPKREWVILEGDEYDTAFFDKRPKFLHYRPRTLILHNLEFDHADIYPNLEAIRQQFRFLLRAVPGEGIIVANGDDPEIVALLKHAYSPVITYGFSDDVDYRAELTGERQDGRQWQLYHKNQLLFSVDWSHIGQHNVLNGLAAVSAALYHGAEPEQVRKGLNSFQGVARRLQIWDEVAGITIYDDFAHHPTAVATTLKGMRAAVNEGERLWAVVEPRSNTMRRRIHQDRLPEALSFADRILMANPDARGLADDELLDVTSLISSLYKQYNREAQVIAHADEAIACLLADVRPGDHIVIMSNGGFGGIHHRLTQALKQKFG